MSDETIPIRSSFVARLTPFRSSEIRARVGGVVLARVYEEGSRVTEGQRLFELDPLPLEAELKLARGRLAAADAGLKIAQVNEARAVRLKEAGFIASSDYDAAIAANRTASAARELAEASVESARIRLSYATVTAPISGKVHSQMVTEGALVGEAGATLLTRIDQVDQLYANFSLTEAQLRQLRNFSEGTIAGREGPNQVVVRSLGGAISERQAQIDFSGVTVDPASGTVEVRALVENKDDAFQAGDSVTITLYLKAADTSRLLPQPSLLRDKQGPYALKVGADGTVSRADLKVQPFPQDGNWIVESGLKASDKVVVVGTQKARPGSRVRTVPWKGRAVEQLGQAPASI